MSETATMTATTMMIKTKAAVQWRRQLGGKAAVAEAEVWWLRWC
jgi:hypothetical protein